MLPSQLLPETLLLLDDLQRQRPPDSKQDERRPLPPEGVNQDTKHEPIQELSVREEVERANRRQLLHEPGEIDPGSHATFRWTGQRVRQEHQ